MPQFAEQLTAARKAKSLTQEQLAQAVHISRSRISRWETGDAVPDLNMIRQLSQVLDFDFLASDQSQSSQPSISGEQPLPSDSPETDQAASAAESQSASPSMRRMRLVVAAVSAVALLFLIFFALRSSPAAPEQVLTPYTQEWYLQETVPVKGEAHVQITPAENPTRAIRMPDFPDGVGWIYEFHCNSLNDIPFTVGKITQTVFGAHGADNQEFTGDMLLSAMQGDLVLAPGRPHHFAWCGGFPLQEVVGVGLAIEGVDANGHELLFRGYVELSQEIAE